MRARLHALREEARAAAVAEGPPVIASDADPRAVDHVRRNAKAAGVAVAVERREVRSLARFEPPGFVVTNPPYGQRLAVEPGLYEDMSSVFRRMSGHTVAVLAGTPAIAQAMHREPDRSIALYNGPIECRLLVYAIG